nr:ribonuclease H-like domain-containing protein [Tanacetum cinerariifolium]
VLGGCWEVVEKVLESRGNSGVEKNQENVRSRSDKGYHAVPLPYTRTYIPPKPDLMFIGEQVESESVDVVTTVSSSVVKTVASKVESVDVKNKGVCSTVETKPVKKNIFSPPIIKYWIYDDESKVEFEPKVEDTNVRPSIEKIKFVKTVRETEKNVETPKHHKHYPRGNQRNCNNIMSQRLGSNFKMINKACYVCGSFEHLHYVCDQRVVRPVWNNTRMMNYKNFANKMTHPHPKRRFVPQAILTKSGKLKTPGTLDNTVRPVNTADSKQIMNYSRPISNVFKRGFSQAIRPFNKYLAYKKTIFNKEVNAVKASAWIKKEFRVARTPQQNGVAERKNRTLIEAARTMALVIKPHNKTPYEIIRGRPPLIDFMKPFGCKFDEGFFVGYFVVSKAMRVYNKKTGIVEKNLSIRYLENAPNVKGNGPDWLFDIDSLTISMNYVPVVAGFQTNGIAGTKDNIVAGQAKKKKEPKQEYILIPICTTGPLISQGPKDSAEDVGKKATEVDASQVLDNGRQDTRSEFKRLIQQERKTEHINNTNSFNNVSSPVSTTGLSFVNAASPSPINAARTLASTNAFEEHPFE